MAARSRRFRFQRRAWPVPLRGSPSGAMRITSPPDGVLVTPPGPQQGALPPAGAVAPHQRPSLSQIREPTYSVLGAATSEIRIAHGRSHRLSKALGAVRMVVDS